MCVYSATGYYRDKELALNGVQVQKPCNELGMNVHAISSRDARSDLTTSRGLITLRDMTTPFLCSARTAPQLFTVVWVELKIGLGLPK